MGPRYQWLIGLLVVAMLAIVGGYAYNMGVAHGIAESGKLAAAPGAAAPLYAWYPHPWGFGFGFFPFFPIFPLLFIFFVFCVLRGLLWRRRWSGYGYGYGCGYGGGVPPAFDEWHRRAHAQPGAPAPDNKA
jgi:hypothetical protein